MLLAGTQVSHCYKIHIKSVFAQHVASAFCLSVILKKYFIRRNVVSQVIKYGLAEYFRDSLCV
jgi:hypothetical protein